MEVVESCINTSGKSGAMFLDDHLRLLVIHGTFTVTYNKEKHTIRKNEFVLIKKAVSVEYEKKGDPSDGDLLEYIMFFLKDEFLNEFLNEYEHKISPRINGGNGLEALSVFTADSRLLGFIESLKPYFS